MSFDAIYHSYYVNDSMYQNLVSAFRGYYVYQR